MDKRSPLPPVAARSLRSRTDGRKLAARMLRELEDMESCSHVCACWIGEEYRERGVPQYDIVARYLAAAKSATSASVETGFTEVLTDFIACALDGSIPSACVYDRTLDAREAAND